MSDKEKLVVTTPDGKEINEEDLSHFIVITGTRMETFESRIMSMVGRPLKIMAGLIFFLFILAIGGSIVLSGLNDTVNNTDSIISKAVSPKARQAQQKAVEAIVDDLDCRDQRNLQNFVNKLVSAGLIQLSTVGPLVEKRCQLETTTTSATTTTIEVNDG